MTKAQAAALMDALETNSVTASALMSFPVGQPETWSVQLDPKIVYTGVQLGALASYCTTHGLTLSAQFTALGVT